MRCCIVKLCPSPSFCTRHFWFKTLQSLERNLSFPGCWYQIGMVQLHLIVSAQVIDDLVHLEKWGRNRHLAFAIVDLDAMKQTLEEVSYPYQLSSSGRAALFVQDPDGNLIELQQE
jgi:glyoxylase I family protein